MAKLVNASTAKKFEVIKGIINSIVAFLMSTQPCLDKINHYMYCHENIQ